MADLPFEDTADDLYEYAPCGYLTTSPDGTILRVNHTFLAWTGYRREDLVGVRRFQELLTPGGQIYHETHYAPLLRMQGSVREIAVDIVTADGHRLPVLVNSVLLTDDDGAPMIVRTTLFDARERKAYERELLASRDRERVARERVERLQRLTAAIVVAPDDFRAILRAVETELLAGLGAERMGLGVAPGGERAVWAPLEAGENGIWVEFAEPTTLNADEHAFLIAAVHQTGLALQRARFHSRTRDVARQLQRSLLGTPLPFDPRYDIAALYAPAVEHLEVGG